MTPRMMAFCRNYLATGNAWRSAVDAGYSRKTADKSCYRIMAHPEVAALIQEAQLSRKTVIKVEATESLLQMADAAREELDEAREDLKSAAKRVRVAKIYVFEVERLIGRKVEKPRSPNARQTTIAEAVEAEHPEPASVQKRERQPYPEPTASPVADWQPSQAPQRSPDAAYSPILDWSDVQFPQKPLMDQSYSPFSND